MTSTIFNLNNEQREACAISIMRTMLVDYSNEKKIPFKKVFFEFSNSPVYRMLFDYSTGLWKEGPDYLRDVFEEVLEESGKANNNEYTDIKGATSDEK